MKYSYLIIFVGWILLIFAQNPAYIHASKDKPEYAYKNIPDELIEKALAVIRKDDYSLEIESKEKSNYKGHVVITILKSRADYLSSKSLYYNNFRKIKGFEGYLYDKNGKLLKKLRNRDIKDESAVSYGSLFSDSRKKLAGFSCKNYPYTVEFEYEIELEGSLHYPGNIFQVSPDISVEQSTFHVITPIENKLRYKEFNLSHPVSITTKDGKSHYFWKEKNLYAYDEEPFAPPYYKVQPIVYLAPNNFVMEGYEGSLQSWNDFGKWILQLNKDRQNLPEKTIMMVKEMVRDIETPLEKAKALYEYLQSTTRYVSIQIGIGGLQPFKAEVVEQYKYGDCKALTNYLMSLLRIAGIQSYYTLVNSGRNAPPLIQDFPSFQFDHIILCIPFENDTTWLECTSQTAPFGFLGSFTDDRDVLVITPEGGKIHRTPAYTAKENSQSRKAMIKLSESGDAQADIVTTYAGLQYENIRGIVHKDAASQKKQLYSRIDIPNFEIKDFSYTLNKKNPPSGIEKLNLNLPQYASPSSNRLFFCPNLMNRFSYIPKKIENRKNNVVTTMRYYDIDTVTYILPEGYEPEYIPESTGIKTRFGQYNIEFELKDKELLYIRRFKTVKDEFSKETYNELRKFLKEIVKHDKSKVILLDSSK